jgi:hypothetical protein
MGWVGDAATDIKTSILDQLTGRVYLRDYTHVMLVKSNLLFILGFKLILQHINHRQDKTTVY